MDCVWNDGLFSEAVDCGIFCYWNRGKIVVMKECFCNSSLVPETVDSFWNGKQFPGTVGSFLG